MWPFQRSHYEEDRKTILRMRRMLRGLAKASQSAKKGKGNRVARWSAGDYRSISAILRTFSTGHPDARDEKQELLEELVNAICTMYKADNRRFDENRFRMDALGYITVGDNGDNGEEG